MTEPHHVYGIGNSQYQSLDSSDHAPDVDSRQLATDRFRAMVERMAAERGRATGWQTDVAGELGIGATVLNHLIAERRRVGIDTVEKVVRKMRIDRDYFYEQGLENPDYRDFIIRAPRTVEPKRPESQGWRQFRQLGLDVKYRELGLDEQQLEWVSRARFRTGDARDAAPYIRLCEDLLERPVEAGPVETLREGRERLRRQKKDR